MKLRRFRPALPIRPRSGLLRVCLVLTALTSATLACNALLPAGATPSAVPLPSLTPVPPTSAPTETLAATEIPEPEPTPTEASAVEAEFIAYVSDGQLLVTDITGGVEGGTTQYTQAGINAGVTDLAWSPSGEFIAYTGLIGSEQHLFYVYAIGEGTPVDLGTGSVSAWSPDSNQLAYQDGGNLWLVGIGVPQPQQLTFQENWAWGRPTFTSDGSALLVTGASFDDMGASGNTSFWIYTVPLDGTGTLTQLPGQTNPVDGRLPYDLRFSPAGDFLSFSTASHVNACGSIGHHYLANPDGSDLSEFPMPSLEAQAVVDQEVYFTPYGYDWNPGGSALVLTGLVRNCKDFAGDVVDTQMALVDLDQQEQWTVVGVYSGPSVSPTSGALGVTLYNADQTAGTVQILDLDGNLVLEVGDGLMAQMQP